MNTNTKGQIAVLEVERRAYELGLIVSRPTIECAYDLIVDDHQRLWRIQVKYANAKSAHSTGVVVIRLDKQTGRRTSYRADEIDAVAAYLPSQDAVVFVQASACAGKRAIYIRVAPSKNGQMAGCTQLDDVIWNQHRTLAQPG